MIRRHLVIMAKLPQAGRVKTRLAKSVGVAEATRVYRCLLAGTIRKLCRDPRWQCWVAVTPDTALGAFTRFAPQSANCVAQGNGNLGDRMQRLFNHLPPGPIAIVGTDIPDLTRDDIAMAFKALGRNDAVLGPAPDGGYWLVGARRAPRVPQFFANVRWSSPHTLADTLDNLKHARVAQLRSIADLDEASDYLGWRKGEALH